MQQRQVEHGDRVIVLGQYSRQVMPPDGARPSSHELPIHVPRTNEVLPVRQGISHFLRRQHGPSIRCSEARLCAEGAFPTNPLGRTIYGMPATRPCLGLSCRARLMAPERLDRAIRRLLTKSPR